MHNLKYSFFLIVLASTVYVSCDDNVQVDTANINATVHGRVYDAMTKTPLAGIPIVLKKRRNCTTTREVLSTTNENGDFNFYVELPKSKFGGVGDNCPDSEVFEIEMDKGYFGHYLDINANQESYEFDIPLKKYSTLLFQIVNKPPLDTVARLRMWVSPLNQLDQIIGFSGVNVRDGVTEMTNFIGNSYTTRITSSDDYSVYYEITRHNIKSDSTFNVFATYGDTTEFVLKY